MILGQLRMGERQMTSAPCSHTVCFWPEQSGLLVHRHSQPQPSCQADPVLLLRILLSLQVEIKSCQRSSNHPLLTFWKNIFTFTFIICNSQILLGSPVYCPYRWNHHSTFYLMLFNGCQGVQRSKHRKRHKISSSLTISSFSSKFCQIQSKI